MKPFPLLFLGTPEFAVSGLRRLMADPRFQIVGVVSQPDRAAGRKMKLSPSPVKSLALEEGIKVWTPERVKGNDGFLEEVKQLGALAAVVVAYGQILPANFLRLFPRGGVNLHASLLPRWRGAAPIQRSLMAGDKKTGVCLQKMVLKMDAGDVLGVREVPLDNEMDAATLSQRLKNLGNELLENELFEYLVGERDGLPQDPAQVSFAPKIMKTETQINWQWPGEKIRDHVRGLVMGPVAWTWFRGKKLQVFKTKAIAPAKARPGEIFYVAPASISVACGSGALEVFEVKLEGKQKQPFAEFLKGTPIKEGEVLGEH